MKQFILTFLLVKCLLVSVLPQGLTLRGIMTDPNLYPVRLVQPQWAKNGSMFYHLRRHELIAVNTKGKIKVVTDLDKLNEAMQKNEYQDLGRFPAIEVIDDKSFIFWQDTVLLKYDFTNNSLSPINTIPVAASYYHIDYENFNIAYTVENNLYLAVNGVSVAISEEVNKGIVYGQVVHREEFGIKEGVFWSPKGKYFAFYRMDETMVTDYPIVNITDPIAKLENIKYPMAGCQNHVVTLGVFDINTKEKIYLKTKHWEDQYLTNIAWSPDERYIYVAVLHRNQKEMMLNRYDAKTGDFLNTVFEEKSDKYVEPLNPLFFLDKNGNTFIWQSKRDGFNHLYKYNNLNDKVEQLTRGAWCVNEIAGWNEKRKLLFITASKASPLEKNLYALNIETGELRRLSKESGNNSVLMSSDGNYLVNTLSSVSVPNKATLIDYKGKEISTLLNSSTKCMDNLLPVQVFTLKANDDSTDLYCRIIKPADFDETKKYPVIVYVYGGPHAQMISNTWTARAGLFLHYLAQQGFVVFTLDNRGSANRGLEFEQVIHKNIGDIEVQDQMTGIEFLKTLPYVDSERIGVHGWSYGGYMTIMMMLKHTDVFKVGVAGAPVTDWKYYEIMYGERYMDTPESNPEGYEKASLLNKIDNLEGKLLIIHGDIDPVVVWQHSLTLLKKSVAKNVIIDYAVYPGHEHNVGGTDRAHLMKRIETYFKDFL